MTKPLSDYTDAEIREQLANAAEHVTYFVNDYLGGARSARSRSSGEAAAAIAGLVK